MNVHRPIHADTSPVRHRFTVADVYSLFATGVFRPDAGVELIDGDVIEMPADGPAHKRYHAELNRLLARGLPDSLRVSVDQTLALAGENATQGPRPGFHVYPAGVHERDLRAAQVLWIIEIADTSLAYDRETKAALYAQYGIADYWIVDVNAKSIIVCREPADDAYASVQVFTADDEVSPLCAPALAVKLAALPRLDD